MRRVVGRFLKVETHLEPRREFVARSDGVLELGKPSRYWTEDGGA
jgi:hypothetical protein